MAAGSEQKCPRNSSLVTYHLATEIFLPREKIIAKSRMRNGNSR